MLVHRTVVGVTVRTTTAFVFVHKKHADSPCKNPDFWFSLARWGAEFFSTVLESLGGG